MKFLNYFLLTALVSLPVIASDTREEEKLAEALEAIFSDDPDNVDLDEEN